MFNRPTPHEIPDSPADPTQQIAVGRGACRGRPAPPGIVAGRRDPQQTCHRLDREVGSGIAPINRYTRTGSSCSPVRTRPPPLPRYRALGRCARVLTPELGHLLALHAGQPIGPPIGPLAGVPVSLANSVPQSTAPWAQTPATIPPAFSRPEPTPPSIGGTPADMPFEILP